MNELRSRSDESYLRFFLGLMVGVLFTLMLTWLFSESLVNDRKSNLTEQKSLNAEERNATQRDRNDEEVVIATADKMQVFYIGVDNPVTISIPGNDSENILVECLACNIKGWKGRYTVTAKKPGEAKVIVSVDGRPPTEFKFRVKRIPDPVARLSRNSGGSIGVGEFKNQGGLGAFLDHFDFDAKCKVQGFNLTYIERGKTQVSSANAGARYNNESKDLINKAKPGDTYLFTNVKAKCPGDLAGRRINSLAFMIK